MIGIETIIEGEGWRARLPDPAAHATRCFEAASARECRLGGSAALLLADDNALKALNARYRGKDRPTNVLSFPSGEAAPAFLGDIAVAYETCAREAAEKGVGFSDHAAHLIVHGLLHLVGYDHEDEVEASAMEALEIQILDAIGVSDPYALEEGAD